jgi:hypothetical protein
MPEIVHTRLDRRALADACRVAEVTEHLLDDRIDEASAAQGHEEAERGRPHAQLVSQLCVAAKGSQRAAEHRDEAVLPVMPIST